MDISTLNFPSLETGDVKIVLGASRIHRVESTRLRLAARLGHEEMEKDGQVDEGCNFGILFAKDRAATLSSKAVKKKVSTRYHIVVTDVTEDEHGRYNVVITPVPLDEDGRPLEHVKPKLGLETGQGTLPVFEAFSEILGSLYDKPIDLGGPNESIEDRVQYAIHMIDLAEQLGVKHTIAPEIIAALHAPSLAEGTSFYCIVANGPAYWLEFGYRLRSRALFREAVIQSAGQFQTTKFKAAAPNLSEATYALVEQKANDLRDRVKRLFHNILSYYPPELHRTAVTGYADTDNIGRNSYSNDIFLWMALTIYRHCVSLEAFAAIDNEDMGYDLVARIAKGGDNYCTMAECGPFFRVFPMTAKARDVVEKKIKEVKDHVKSWAEILTRQYAYPDPDTEGLGFFTCVDVAEDEWPFEEIDRD